MCAGRLFSAPPLPMSKPNFVAITTSSRDGSERLADQLFVRVRPVDLGRVEERDAMVVRRADDLDAQPAIGWGP
jgi:hypothetical protein